MGISVLLFLLVSVSFLPLIARFETLKEQKQAAFERTSYETIKYDEISVPQAEQLPTLIDQCLRIFEEEKVGLRSFNLERFGSVGGQVEHSSLNYALVRIKLFGSWEDIQRGIMKVENLPNQAIHAQEVKLRADEGELLLKMFFQEPDNPL